MNATGRFWDRIADRYARKPVADEAAYQKKLEITRTFLRPDMEVMEFGCGTGSTAIAHAPYVAHILAADISARMIEIARTKADTAGVTNVTFHRQAFDDLAIDDEVFDAVMGHSILHLVDDRDAAIARVRDMLKPGGVFVSNTVCIGDKMKWFKFVGPVGRMLGLMPLIRVFTTRELADSLTAAGFAIEHQWTPEGAVSVFIVARKPA